MKYKTVEQMRNALRRNGHSYWDTRGGATNERGAAFLIDMPYSTLRTSARGTDRAPQCHRHTERGNGVIYLLADIREWLLARSYIT